MYFFVGSSNPVKMRAVQQATQGKWPDAQIFGYEVESQVRPQPMTDEETQTGAINRAKAALAAGLREHPEAKESEYLGVGLEGGVTNWQDELWSTVWVAVVDQDDQVISTNGMRMKIHPKIAEPILAGGEMGPIMAELVGQNDVRKKQGMIGVVTNNFVDRAEEYGAIAKLAIGLWYGKNWDAQVK